MKKTIVLALLAILCSTAFAALPKGYKFTLTIERNTDSVIYLGHYFAGKTYAIDTAYRNRKGSFVFEKKDRTLLPGLYFFSNPAGKYVEFMVHNEKPEFTFTTKDFQWTVNMQVKGSYENKVFYDFHRLNYEIYNAIEEQRTHNMPDSLFKPYYKQMTARLDSAKQALIHNEPTLLISRMMNATTEPIVPLVDNNGDTLTSKQRLEYYMLHYFDNSSLDDDAMVRTPEETFLRRVNNYLDKYLHGATPDTICRYVDMMIDRARPSKEVFKYLVHTVTEKYLQSNIMSYDAVYVHMIKKYYGSGEAFWASPTVIDENVARATKWERLLIGNDAPELILKDRGGFVHSLHHTGHKYTLLVFWSPSCGHCKVIIPELYKAFLETTERYDVCAFAILSELDNETRNRWGDFIEKNNMTHPRWINLDGGEANIDWHDVYDVITTPQIYLIGQDGTILAKKLNAETYRSIIEAFDQRFNGK